MRRNYFWLFLAILALIVGYLYLNRDVQPASKAVDGPIDTWSSYASPRFRVQLSYPAHWKLTNVAERDRYSGVNGFLVISALGGTYSSIDQAMLKVVGTQVRPYGTDPTIERLTIGEQGARLIMPSADQPATMNHEAAFIAAYPRPVRYGSEFYGYVVVYADADHIRDIVGTLKFLSSTSNVLATVSGRVVFDPVCLTTDKDNAAKRATACVIAKGAFNDRRVLIYDDTGKRLIQTLTPAADGSYRVELEAGNYVLDINYIGLDRSVDVPVVLNLEPGATKTANIVIDTGVGASVK